MTADHGLCERLVRVLQLERACGAQALRDMHALPLEERVEAGESLRGLELVASDRDRIRLRCERNLSRFRPGDLLWLSDGDMIQRGLAVVFVAEDAAGVVTVERDRFLGGREPVAGAELVLDRRDLDLVDRNIQAVRSLFAEPGSAPARALLEGTRDQAQPVPRITDERQARAAGLDPEQTAAFLAAGARPFHLVQGPPGAGKTRLAGALVRAFAAAGQRVLVAAFTHRAVNNVLREVVADRVAAPVCKIGAAGQADGLLALGVAQIPSARLAQDVRGPAVVGVTTHGATGLKGEAFDLVLLDEAGQISLAHAAAALRLAPRHVLVGDHRQLPPLVVGEHADELAYRSVFEHLHAAYGSQLLTRTYRMNQELCAFPSRVFYDGRLQPAAGNRDRRLDLERVTSAVLAPAPAAAILRVNHLGARGVSEPEAVVAADLAARAVAGGAAPEEVAVIAPHRAHGNRIRALLRRRLDHLPPERLPLVDTVERLQGGERDLVILSLAASDPEAILSEASFFFSPRRLNVSLTRARRKLIVLLSEAILDAYPDDPEALRGADLLRRLERSLPGFAWDGGGDCGAEHE